MRFCFAQSAHNFKAAGAKSSECGGWGMITVLFLAKNLRTSINEWDGVLSWCKIHDWFFHNYVRFCFAQSAHNFKAVFLIDRTTLWQEFIMHHAISIEENKWAKSSHLTELDVLFSVLALLNASIGMIRLWFPYHSHTITPMIRYGLFVFWIVFKRRQHILSDVHATLFLNNPRCRTFHG